MTTFVALVQQGMILDQKAIAVDSNQEVLERHANAAAEKLNQAQRGESEGWTAVVLPVEGK